jgi:hypothetical protein
MKAESIFRRGLTFPELSVGLAFVTIAALACLSPAQSDTFWALRAGEDFWRTGRVPLVDTYSHTAFGRPWPNHEWLWQALAYALYRMGGFPLLTAVAAAVVTGAYVLVYRTMSGPWPIRLALLSAGVVLGAIGWSLRPQLVSLLFLAVLIWLLVRERLWFIPPLFCLWANLHGGVVLGGLVMVVATISSLVFERRLFPRLAFSTALAGVATLLTPLGPGLWSFIVHWMLAAQKTGVSEWEPLAMASREGIVFGVLAMAFVILAVRRWRVSGLWPDRLLVILAIMLLELAARTARNVPMFVLVAMPAASRLIGASLASRPAVADRRALAHLGVLIAGVVGAAASVFVCWTLPQPRLGWRPIAPAAVAAIADCPGPLYNSYDAGGVLIWFAREKRVFVDSRHDPYPPEFIVEDRLVEQGGDHVALFQRWGLKCAVTSVDAALGDRIRGTGWHERYRDAQWVLLDRK